MMSQTADCLPNRDRAGAAIGRFPSAERREPKGDRELGADWSTLFTSETTAKEGWTEESVNWEESSANVCRESI